MTRPLDLTGQEQFINLVTYAPKESTIVWDEGSKPVLVPQNKVIVDEKYKDCLCCASQLIKHKIIDHSVYVKDFSTLKREKGKEFNCRICNKEIPINIPSTSSCSIGCYNKDNR